VGLIVLRRCGPQGAKRVEDRAPPLPQGGATSESAGRCREGTSATACANQMRQRLSFAMLVLPWRHRRHTAGRLVGPILTARRRRVEQLAMSSAVQSRATPSGRPPKRLLRVLPIAAWTPFFAAAQRTPPSH